MHLDNLSNLINIRQYLHNQLFNGQSIKKEDLNKVNKLIAQLDQHIIGKALALDLSKVEDYETILNHTSQRSVTVRSSDEDFESATKRVLADRPVQPLGSVVVGDNGVVTVQGPSVTVTAPTADSGPSAPSATAIEAKASPRREVKKSFKRVDAEDDDEG